MKYDFLGDILKFNEMYKIQSNDKPTDLGAQRLMQFKEILSEELDEADLIIKNYHGGLGDLTDISDWLGDIIVYCASEARRWGLPVEGILKIIMDSNFSKLGDDGKPIYDERNKVMKGSNYWKPEQKIFELLIEVSK